MPASILRWGNSLTTLFVPQRSMLFGLPWALTVIYQWLQTIQDPDSSKSRMAAAGIWAGLLPLIHAHTFAVVTGMGVCLAVLFRSLWRSWLWFFALMSLIALPEALWLAHNSGVVVQHYLGWQLGWDREISGANPPQSYNPVWFWIVN